MKRDQNCIFCQIAEKKVPSKIIFENDKFMAFLDIFPISKGHTIVIPKEHHHNIESIPDDELGEIHVLIKRLSIQIREKLDFDGYNILQNNFPAAGQEINHYHVHIIPRNENDERFRLKIPRYQADESDLEDVLKSLLS